MRGHTSNADVDDGDDDDDDHDYYQNPETMTMIMMLVVVVVTVMVTVIDHYLHWGHIVVHWGQQSSLLHLGYFKSSIHFFFIKISNAALFSLSFIHL